MVEKKIEQILKLLALAEGTNSEEEAKAATEAAQRLASINSIELELVYARQAQKEKREEPTAKKLQVGEPGREHKNRFWVDLMLEITEVNDVEVTITHDRAHINCFGYPSDIEVCEILFASLNTQMVAFAGESLRRGEHREHGVHGKTWRNNFYEAFIREIGRRLRTAKREAMAEMKKRDEEIAARLEPVLAAATTEAPKPAVTAELVMVTKKEAVRDYYMKSRGRVRGSYNSYGAGTKNSTAQGAGRAAGQQARIGNQGALGGGGTRQIG